MATVFVEVSIWYVWNMEEHLNSMACIFERGITLIHPYSRNKSDQKDKFFENFLVVFEI